MSDLRLLGELFLTFDLGDKTFPKAGVVCERPQPNYVCLKGMGGDFWKRKFVNCNSWLRARSRSFNVVNLGCLLFKCQVLNRAWVK